MRVLVTTAISQVVEALALPRRKWNLCFRHLLFSYVQYQFKI